MNSQETSFKEIIDIAEQKQLNEKKVEVMKKLELVKRTQQIMENKVDECFIKTAYTNKKEMQAFYDKYKLT